MKTILTLLLLFTIITVNAQVGIGTTNPQAQLDIPASNQAAPVNTDGILIPRVDAFSETNPTATQQGMLVYLTTTDGTDTPGFYYWNNPTAWLPLGRTNEWSLTGNAGTSPATNFLGTTDAQSFVVRTNNNERMRVLANGNVGIGITAPSALFETNFGTDDFASIKANGRYDAYGYLGVQGVDDYDGNTTLDISGQEIGVLGISSGATSTDNVGVYGYSNTVGVRAQHSVNSNWAELGTTDFAGNFNGRVAIVGGSDASGTTGTGTLEINNSLRIDANEVITNDDTILYLQNGNNGDLRVDGSTLTVDASTNRVGVGDTTPLAKLEVYSNSATERGLAIRKTSGTADGAMILQQDDGNGLYVQASNAGRHGINAGSGGFLTNTVLNAGDPYGLNNFGASSGVAGAGSQIGVIGCADSANSATEDKAGGWFYVQNAGGGGYATMAVVGAVVNGTNYKILGRGLVSTIVKDEENNDRIMVAPEAPEALLQDYGVGKLTQGKAHIIIDPILSKNILVDNAHPLKVFIQLEGNCNGVYVTNKTKTSFDVIELDNGSTTVDFSYQIVATRADETNNGRVSKYSDMRFKKLNWKVNKLNNYAEVVAKEVANGGQESETELLETAKNHLITNNSELIPVEE